MLISGPGLKTRSPATVSVHFEKGARMLNWNIEFEFYVRAVDMCRQRKKGVGR